MFNIMKFINDIRYARSRINNYPNIKKSIEDNADILKNKISDKLNELSKLKAETSNLDEIKKIQKFENILNKKNNISGIENYIDKWLQPHTDDYNASKQALSTLGKTSALGGGAGILALYNKDNISDFIEKHPWLSGTVGGLTSLGLAHKYVPTHIGRYLPTLSPTQLYYDINSLRGKPVKYVFNNKPIAPSIKEGREHLNNKIEHSKSEISDLKNNVRTYSYKSDKIKKDIIDGYERNIDRDNKQLHDYKSIPYRAALNPIAMGGTLYGAKKAYDENENIKNNPIEQIKNFTSDAKDSIKNFTSDAKDSIENWVDAHDEGLTGGAIGAAGIIGIGSVYNYLKNRKK